MFQPFYPGSPVSRGTFLPCKQALIREMPWDCFFWNLAFVVAYNWMRLPSVTLVRIWANHAGKLNYLTVPSAAKYQFLLTNLLEQLVRNTLIQSWQCLMFSKLERLVHAKPIFRYSISFKIECHERFWDRVSSIIGMKIRNILKDILNVSRTIAVSYFKQKVS